MAAAVRTEHPRTHPGEPSLVAVLSSWAQQGVQSFFATQRILLDLVMRQNASVMHSLRQQLSDPHHSPTTLLSEMAGEGMANFMDGQKVLLELAREQNKILMTGVKERLGDWPAAHAVTDMLRRSVETFLSMQQEFLHIAGKQTHTWVEAARSGKAFDGERFLELAREGMEQFVKAQKEFLDVIAEETAKATGGQRAAIKPMKKTELTELARTATQSFIDAQKKLLNVAGQQMNTNVKLAGKTLDLVKPFPFMPFAELTREGVKSYVDAQKAFMDTMIKPTNGHSRSEKPKGRTKRPTRATAKAMAATA